MAVSNLISPVDPSGTYPSIPDGSNRMLFLTLCYQNSSGNVTAPPAPTIGDVTPTFVCGDASGAVRNRGILATYVITESQIASMSGLAIVLNGSAPIKRSIAWGVKDARQDIPTRFGTQYVTSGATSISLARDANSWTFLGAFVEIAESITLSNPSWNSRILSVNIGYAADSLRTVNSTTQSKSYIQNVHALNIEPVPAYLINSTNSGNPVKVGATFSSSVTGFTGVASGTIGGKALTGLSYSSNTITATAPVYVDGATFYEPDTDQTLTYVNGSETASATITTASPDGMASVVIASPVTDDSTYIGSVYTLANDDRWVYPTLGGDFFADADGKINALNAGTYVCWHWRVSDSVMTQVTLNISEAGAIVSASGLTSSGLTFSGLTRIGLTSSGL